MSAAIEGKISGCVAKMLEKLPLGKRLTTTVALHIMSVKFAADFTGVDLKAHSAFIDTLLAQPATQAAAPPPPPVSKAAAKKAAPAADSDEEDESSDDGSYDEEADDSDEEGDDEEGGGEGEGEEDEEDEDEFESDEESDEEDGADALAGPPAKKTRTEDGTVPAGDASGEAPSAVQRAKEMAACLSKLHIRYRKQEENESIEAYVAELSAIFEKNKLDPLRHARDDVKRYAMLRELADLQSDGANAALDRNSRAGRGHFATMAPVAPPKNYLLDD